MKSKSNKSKQFEFFFDSFKLEDAKNKLSECIEVCICSENQAFETARSREDLIFFYKQLIKLIEMAKQKCEN